MKKKALIVTALVATLGGGLITAKVIAGEGGYCDRGGMHKSHFGGHKGGPMAFGMHKMERLAERLDLSDEQRDKVFAILDEARPEMRDTMFELRDERKNFMQLDPQADNYAAETDRMAKLAGEKAEQMVRKMAELKARILAELNDEQRAELEQMMEKRGKGRWM